MNYADYMEKQYFHVKRREEAYKTSWEQTRYIAYCTVATVTDKVRKPQDLMPFPWEEGSKRITKRQLDKIQKDAVKTYDAHLRFLNQRDGKLRGA